MQLDDYLQHEIAVGSFPGAAYAIGSLRGIEQEGAHGHAIAVPLRIAATTDTIYDCASITKPLITTTLVLQAVAEGRVTLDEQFHGFTIRSLLAHTSGLRAWMPLYAYDSDYLATILEMGREDDAGTRVIYSDLNFVMLFYLVEQLFGSYVEAARARIITPLQLRDATFHPPATWKPRIAATEWGQRFEARLGSRFDIPVARTGLMWGEANDGNSFHHSGTAGNAGLFATARDVFAIAAAFARGELVPRELVAEATRDQTAGLDSGSNGARGLGWQLRGDNAATSMLGPRSYGHTGFTGTSVWIDPDADRIYVLLTNRVHPCAAPIAMQTIRGEFHRLA